MITFQERRRLKIQISSTISRLKLKQLGQRELDEVARILVDDIKNRTPVDTGKLRNSITFKRVSTGREIYIRGKRNNEVGEFQHFGTKAHMVRPKKKNGVLAWVGAGGATFFSRGHKVKGIKALKFFKPRQSAIRQAMRLVTTFLKAK